MTSSQPANADRWTRFLVLAQQGDRQAFADLAEEAEPVLRRFVYSILLDAELAKDAVQDTFLKLWASLAGFQPRRSTSGKTWVYTIAFRAACDIWRHRKRGKRLFRPLSAASLAHVDGGAANPLDEVLRAELAHEALQLLQRLSPKDRTAFRLLEIEGLSREEAARVLGCTINALNARTCRLREKLRAALCPES
jgi:RNA polymerase sigma-70 factor (ECF subfamily)